MTLTILHKSANLPISYLVSWTSNPYEPTVSANLQYHSLSLSPVCSDSLQFSNLCTLQRKSNLCIPFLGIAGPTSQFPHSRVCERFVYFQDRSTYFLQQNSRLIVGIYKSLTDTRAILCCEYLFRIFGVGSL
jgi:hypothetical protein